MSASPDDRRWSPSPADRIRSPSPDDRIRSPSPADRIRSPSPDCPNGEWHPNYRETYRDPYAPEGDKP
jgi:hypothetical protein